MALFSSFVELLPDVLILMIAPFVIDDSSGHCIVLIFSLCLCVIKCIVTAGHKLFCSQ